MGNMGGFGKMWGNMGALDSLHKLWWKGDDGTGGVGVMVKEDLMEKVLEVRRKSAKVMKI
jgi:hypothetical protein